MQTMCYVIRDSSKPFTLAEDMLRNGRNPIISGEELKRQPGILSIRAVKLQQQQLKQKKRNNFVRNTVFAITLSPCWTARSSGKWFVNKDSRVCKQAAGVERNLPLEFIF